MSKWLPLSLAQCFQVLFPAPSPVGQPPRCSQARTAAWTKGWRWNSSRVARQDLASIPAHDNQREIAALGRFWLQTRGSSKGILKFATVSGPLTRTPQMTRARWWDVTYEHAWNLQDRLGSHLTLLPLAALAASIIGWPEKVRMLSSSPGHASTRRRHEGDHGSAG